MNHLKRMWLRYRIDTLRAALAYDEEYIRELAGRLQHQESVAREHAEQLVRARRKLAALEIAGARVA